MQHSHTHTYTYTHTHNSSFPQAEALFEPVSVTGPWCFRGSLAVPYIFVHWEVKSKHKRAQTGTVSTCGTRPKKQKQQKQPNVEWCPADFPLSDPKSFSRIFGRIRETKQKPAAPLLRGPNLAAVLRSTG